MFLAVLLQTWNAIIYLSSVNKGLYVLAGVYDFFLLSEKRFMHHSEYIYYRYEGKFLLAQNRMACMFEKNQITVLAVNRTLGHKLDTHSLMTILFSKEVVEAMVFNCLLLHKPESI